MEFKKTLHNLEETKKVAHEFVKTLAPQESGATIVTLSGELGAGKTSFVQGVAEALGIEATIISPTFVLERIYKIPEGSFKHLVHIDAYRLNGGDELKTLGFNEVSKDKGALVVLEWPEKVEGALPETVRKITLTYIGDDEREMTIL